MDAVAQEREGKRRRRRTSLCASKGRERERRESGQKRRRRRRIHSVSWKRPEEANLPAEGGEERKIMGKCNLSFQPVETGRGEEGQ